LTRSYPADVWHAIPGRSPWVLPGVMTGISFLALAAAQTWDGWSRLLYLIPYTFLGNSLAPLPYDGAVVYLGGRHDLWLIVAVAIAATVIIEAWNMEVLARVLAREGTRGFRSHRFTQWSLRWYRKAPFWSLLVSCVLPVVPHYPMRFLAVLAGYPLWKYQISVILGRGTRYAALAGLGVALPIPGRWIVLASLVALAFGVRGARRMNRTPEATLGARPTTALPEEA
jgi:membrane protein YqaA with SNARE-associated domain